MDKPNDVDAQATIGEEVERGPVRTPAAAVDGEEFPVGGAVVQREDISSWTALGGERDERHGCHRQGSVDYSAAVREDSCPGQSDDWVATRHQTPMR